MAGVKYLAIGLDHFAVPDEDPMLKMTDGDLFAAVLPEQNHRRLDDMLEDVELMADAEAAGVAQLAAR